MVHFFGVDGGWFHFAELQKSERHLQEKLITSFDLLSYNHQTHSDCLETPI